MNDDPEPLSKNNPSTFNNLSPQQMVSVNRWCDRYEEKWADSHVPSLSAFVKSINIDDAKTYEALAMELTVMDIQYRRRAGKYPTLRRYNELFPMLGEGVIASMLHPAPGSSEGTLPETPLSTREALYAGQQIGDYVIEERIGSGGMGDVYRAQHQLMGRAVAIKALKLRTTEELSNLRRFEQEVQSVAKMSHVNVVTAFDARLEGGSLFLVTEWIQGKNLAETVSDTGPLSIQEALDVAIQAANGLAYAHAMGFIHRDVKPGNLMRAPNGNVKLLDLGLAKLVQRHEDPSDSSTESISLTKNNQLLGTAEYMSPEQARTPNHLDVRTDIYSLGCTLMFLLTGKPPFVGETPIDTLLLHVDATPPTLSARTTRSTVPVKLESLVQSMLSPSVEHRPASMSVVLDELNCILQELKIEKDAPSYRNSIRANWLTRRASIVYAALLLIAATGTIGWILREQPLPSLTTPIPAPASPTFGQPGSLSFDGLTSYAEVLNFDQEVTRSAMIEVVTTPQQGEFPCNLVTWGGEDLLALFAGSNGNWGVASLHDGVSRLEVSRDSFDFGRRYLIAAKCSDEGLELWVDGIQVPTRSQDYELASSQTTLYFGGLPDAFLPQGQGTRFYCGLIHQVKISSGDRLQAARQASDLLTAEPTTVALFDLSIGNEGGNQVRSTVNGFTANLVNTQWVQSTLTSSTMKWRFE